MFRSCLFAGHIFTSRRFQNDALQSSEESSKTGIYSDYNNKHSAASGSRLNKCAVGRNVTNVVGCIQIVRGQILVCVQSSGIDYAGVGERGLCRKVLCREDVNRERWWYKDQNEWTSE